MFELDDLKIYRGNDIQITPKIIVAQPTIGQIEEFGEKRYFNVQLHKLNLPFQCTPSTLNDSVHSKYSSSVESYSISPTTIGLSINVWNLTTTPLALENDLPYNLIGNSLESA